MLLCYCALGPVGEMSLPFLDAKGREENYLMKWNFKLRIS